MAQRIRRSSSSTGSTSTVAAATTSTGSTSSGTKKLRSARTPPASGSNSNCRPVLGALHTNPSARRVPTRMQQGTTTSTGSAKVGEKRKRVLSANENTHSHGQPRRLKRQRSASDESDKSGEDMDVDEGQMNISDDEGQSSEGWLINDAPASRLERMLKADLIQLYQSHEVGDDDVSALTKREIAQVIVEAREDPAPLPPSSPPRDGGSSECSSDDGNFAGDEETEETDGGRACLVPSTKRRATITDLSQIASRPSKGGRSLSLGNMFKRATRESNNGEGSSTGSTSSKRSSKSSRRSSPTESTSAASAFPSPPVTRLRAARKQSNEKLSTSTTASANTSTATRKGKGKQVEFSESVAVVEIESMGPLRMRAHPEESDGELTEIEELEEQMFGTPSPRRTRSKGPGDTTGTVIDLGRRVTPARKAKGRIGSFKEEDSDDDDAEVYESVEGDEDEDEEMASASTTPTRKPAKRQRTRQTHTPPSDGDDEKEDEKEEALDEEDEETVVEKQPRKLKAVVEDVVEENEEDPDAEGDEIDVDADVDAEADEDEPMEEDVDLALATTKSLHRLRRDDLVRLCETRDIQPLGNKQILAKSLLQWRDRQSGSEFSSPSSTGTVRPPSTTRPGAKGESVDLSEPVLMRDKEDRFHMDEPRTPPVSSHRKETEPELELDLESLGLDDREIPCDRISKLEKIGSGGFKDVFIGKYRGRKIAISEFRGHLTTMDIKELKLLGGFDHPNIVRFIGVSIPENTRDGPVMIISELCSNGDLFDYVRNVPAPSIYRVFSIMLDIAKGVKYLHDCSPSIIHRDCKSSNILISGKHTAKIADFGLAKVKQSTRSMVRSLVGTVNWQAPELWSAHPEYNHKVDVFSCAMVYWEMLQWHLKEKKFPWEGMNEHAIYETVGAKKQRPSLTGLRKQWGGDIVDLMVDMWAHNHEDRPTISEVVGRLVAIIEKTPKAIRVAVSA